MLTKTLADSKDNFEDKVGEGPLPISHLLKPQS